MKQKTYLYALYLVVATLVIAALSYLYLAVRQPAVKPEEEEQFDDNRQQRGLIVTSKKWTGDFDKMLEERRIRFLVPHGHTLYFIIKGRERGLIGDTVRDFEHYLNKKYAKKLKRRPLTVFIIPRTRDALLKDVVSGRGDIAAGDITVTQERLKMVDFVGPVEIPIESEILVTGQNSPTVSTIDDLSGKTVHVRKSTSYYESLSALNERFKKEKKEPVKIIFVPDALEDEDLMEMLNAGIFELLVVDDWMAKIWAQILPKIKVREDVVLRGGGTTGWAIRKGSPGMEAEIRDFCRNYLKKQGIVERRLAEYHKGIKKIMNPMGNTAEWKRFQNITALFEKYGQKYSFDWLMLAAQGYQESALDQNKRSPAGAIGIMQIMPATGASMKVGDIKITEPNIHAGAKYMNSLMKDYFPDANFNEHERSLFAFASYNAGPGKISRMRKIAEERGLDPNKWFNNVELVTAEKIGFQTTTYVRNIYKYYIAYKLTIRNIEKKRQLREQVAPSNTWKNE